MCVTKAYSVQPCHGKPVFICDEVFLITVKTVERVKRVGKSPAIPW